MRSRERALERQANNLTHNIPLVLNVSNSWKLALCDTLTKLCHLFIHTLLEILVIKQVSTEYSALLEWQ
jgi:hypothetical protein